jgi:hypothetical protein
MFKKMFSKTSKEVNNLSNINSTFKRVEESDDSNDEDGSGAFRDGFNMLGGLNEVKESKINFNIVSKEEGSDQETLKNPDLKSKKSEEIYTDATNQSFKESGTLVIKEKEEVISSSNVVISDELGNKIIKSIKKNSKGFSSRGI